MSQLAKAGASQLNDLSLISTSYQGKIESILSTCTDIITKSISTHTHIFENTYIHISEYNFKQLEIICFMIFFHTTPF